MRIAKNRSLRFSIYFLGAVLLIGLLAPIIANEKALLAKDSEGWSMPFLGSDLKVESSYTVKVPALIPYSEGSIDLNHTNSVGPFEHQNTESWHQRHWLGTDPLGRDVLTQLIYGCRTAAIIGFGSVFIAFIIGLLLGGIAGYLGDNHLRIGRLRAFVLLTLACIWLICLMVIPPYNLSQHANQFSLIFWMLFILGTLIIASTNYALKKVETNQSRFFALPLDLLISRLIEVIESLPMIMLVIALGSIMNNGILNLCVILGLLSWTGIARLFRSEILKTKNLNYIKSSKALGYDSSRIILKHLLPNTIQPIWVSVSFGLAAAILIEAAFSFLGLGLTADQASWGSMIASARSDFNAWWLTLFPGLVIFATLFSANTMADHFSKKKESI